MLRPPPRTWLSPVSGCCHQTGLAVRTLESEDSQDSGSVFMRSHHLEEADQHRRSKLRSDGGNMHKPADAGGNSGGRPGCIFRPADHFNERDEELDHHPGWSFQDRGFWQRATEFSNTVRRPSSLPSMWAIILKTWPTSRPAWIAFRI